MSAFPNFLRYTIHIRAPNGVPNGSRMRTMPTLEKVILDPSGSTITINMAGTTRVRDRFICLVNLTLSL